MVLINKNNMINNNSLNIDNKNKDLKFFVEYIGYTEKIDDFLNSTSCEIVYIETSEKYITILYKEIK